MSFLYAHKNTSEGERSTATAKFNKPRISPHIAVVRERAFQAEIPVSDDETLSFLITLVNALKPEKILELGTAVGVSGAVMLENCARAHLTTIERDENFYNSAKQNFANFGLSDRVNLILGDAGEKMQSLGGEYDLIFLDCAKVQYVKYLPRLKKLLKKGGTLVADDVLLYGYVAGEVETPKKRRMLVEHIREYLRALETDQELETQILELGEGLAVSHKKRNDI